MYPAGQRDGTPYEKISPGQEIDEATSELNPKNGGHEAPGSGISRATAYSRPVSGSGREVQRSHL